MGLPSRGLRVTNRVVLDSDFCQILLSKHNQDEAKAFFKSIFKCLKISPILHEYVYKEELFNNECILDLVAENVIEIAKLENFVSSADDKALYEILFKDYYKFMNGKNWADQNDVFSKRHAGKNMGEIHSLILAQYEQIPCFFSNDKGAKVLAKSKINTQEFAIEVKNVEQVFQDIDTTKHNGVDLKERKRILKFIKNKK